MHFQHGELEALGSGFLPSSSTDRFGNKQFADHPLVDSGAPVSTLLSSPTNATSGLLKSHLLVSVVVDCIYLVHRSLNQTQGSL